MVHIFNGVMPFDMLLLWEFNFVYGYFFCNIILQEQTFRIGPDWFFSIWFGVQLLVTKKTLNQTRLKTGQMFVLRTNFYLSH